MYNYYFDKEIDTDSVNELVGNLQEREGEINLWFSTSGGSPDAMQFLIQFLNSRKQDITITITEWLMSAGTHLLTDFEGKIIIGDLLDFMLFHVVDRESYNLRTEGAVSDKMLMKQDYEKNVIFAEKLKERGFLTDKQVTAFLKGKDVILYSKDFKNLKIND